jgi:hypothetical protein
MNRNTVVLIFAVLSIATVLYWVRISGPEKVPAPGASSVPSAGVPSAPRKSPAEYAAMMETLSKEMYAFETLHPDDQRIAVAAMIELFRNQQQGVITKPAEYYVRRINETILTNGEIEQMPLDRVLMVLAVMEYDYDNGRDKDELAKEVLGPAMYEANKQRRAQQGLAA